MSICDFALTLQSSTVHKFYANFARTNIFLRLNAHGHANYLPWFLAYRYSQPAPIMSSYGTTVQNQPFEAGVKKTFRENLWAQSHSCFLQQTSYPKSGQIFFLLK
jgi:hypothetical protein